jgi:hypothetical protein
LAKGPNLYPYLFSYGKGVTFDHMEKGRERGLDLLPNNQAYNKPVI